MANVPISNLTTTWNASGTTFTGFKLNVTDTASAAGSLLMDLQVGGVSKFRVDKTGKTSVFGNGAGNVTLIEGYYDSGSTRQFYLDSFAQMYFRGGGISFGSSAGSSSDMWIQGGNGFIYLKSTGAIGWGASAASGAIDTTLYRDAANTLAQRNGVNAQTFRLYNTYTDASNYERGFMRWNSNALEIGAEGAGTGANRSMRLGNGSGSVASAAWINVSFSPYTATISTPSTSDLVLNPAVAVIINSVASPNVGLNNSSYGRNGIFYEPVTADINIGFRPNWGYDQSVKALRITGAGQWAAATTNLIGGHVFVTGGAGASGSSGEAKGGDVTIRGGTGYGTGRNGLIIMDNLPTTNPTVAGALWNNSGVLSVSAG